MFRPGRSLVLAMLAIASISAGGPARAAGAHDATPAAPAATATGRSGPLLLASTTKDEIKGNGGSDTPDLSGSGNVVAFDTTSTNFDPSDTTGSTDVYVKDLTTGDLTLASTSTSGVKGDLDSGSPSVSGGGSIVAFESTSTNLDPGHTSDSYDVYVKDLTTGVLTLASTSDTGGSSDAFSGLPSISGSGRLVAFESAATTLDPGDTDAIRDIYVKDVSTGDLSLVSTSTLGTKGDLESISASFSASGKRVAFNSAADNLDPADGDTTMDVYVKVLATGKLVLASVSATGTKGNQPSSNPSLDGSGRKVAFVSLASNLGPTDGNGTYDIYVKNLRTGEVTLASSTKAGVAGNSQSVNPDLSANGKHVTFASNATNLDPADTSTDWDIYEKNLVTGRIRLMSDDASRVKGNQTLQTFPHPTVAGSGQLVAFDLNPTNLDAADTDTLTDVYVKNATTCTIVGTDGNDTLVGTDGHDVICGTEGNDTIDGAGGNDILFGGSGSDSLQGGPGKDTIKGDDGVDTLDYQDSTNSVVVDMGAHTAVGADATGDTFANVESLQGSAYPDTLTGDDRVNGLIGLDGDDVMAGGGGADLLLGGDGIDILDYRTSPAAVNVDLATGVLGGGDAEGDGILGFEGVIGSAFDDTLTGDAGNNFFLGMGGADVIDGGAGIDLANYYYSPAAVTVKLNNGVVRGGDAEGDVLTGIENVAGSAFDDTLTGDDNANVLTGLDGADTLTGKGGDDTLIGGAGVDTFDGGGGTDTCDDVAGESATSCEI